MKERRINTRPWLQFLFRIILLHVRIKELIIGAIQVFGLVKCSLYTLLKLVVSSLRLYSESPPLTYFVCNVEYPHRRLHWNKLFIQWILDLTRRNIEYHYTETRVSFVFKEEKLAHSNLPRTKSLH